MLNATFEKYNKPLDLKKVLHIFPLENIFFSLRHWTCIFFLLQSKQFLMGVPTYMLQFQIEIELIDFLHNVITNVLVNHKKNSTWHVKTIFHVKFEVANQCDCVVDIRQKKYLNRTPCKYLFKFDCYLLRNRELSIWWLCV